MRKCVYISSFYKEIYFACNIMTEETQLILSCFWIDTIKITLCISYSFTSIFRFLSLLLTNGKILTKMSISLKIFFWIY